MAPVGIATIHGEQFQVTCDGDPLDKLNEVNCADGTPLVIGEEGCIQRRRHVIAENLRQK